MKVIELLNSVDRSDMLDFYNEFFEPVITREKLDDQIALFNRQVLERNDAVIHIREHEGDIVAKRIGNADDGLAADQVGTLVDFALDFEPWGRVLAMQVSRDNLDELEDYALAALLFEEMIWHGWTEEDQHARRHDAEDSATEALNEMVRTNHPMVQRLAAAAEQVQRAAAEKNFISVAHLHGEELRAHMRTLPRTGGLIDLSDLTHEQLVIVMSTPRQTDGS